jgi:hypothetical protein
MKTETEEQNQAVGFIQQDEDLSSYGRRAKY